MSTALTFMAAQMALARVVQESLPPTPPDTLEKIVAVEDALKQTQQIELVTEHVLHGGMYARTVTLEPGTVITGALIKIPTLIVLKGHCKVLVGDEWGEHIGYHVIPAMAGRKQVFVALSQTTITMCFPTQAKTVEDAEREFTDQHEQLLSRQSTEDVVIITGA